MAATRKTTTEAAEATEATKTTKTTTATEATKATRTDGVTTTPAPTPRSRPLTPTSDNRGSIHADHAARRLPHTRPLT